MKDQWEWEGLGETSPRCAMCGHAKHLHSDLKGCRALIRHLPKAEAFFYGDIQGRSAVCDCETFVEIKS